MTNLLNFNYLKNTIGFMATEAVTIASKHPFVKNTIIGCLSKTNFDSFELEKITRKEKFEEKIHLQIFL